MCATRSNIRALSITEVDTQGRIQHATIWERQAWFKVVGQRPTYTATLLHLEACCSPFLPKFCL
jgi:hypothetical protein